MTTTLPDNDELLDLLTKRATEGLDAAQSARLDALLREHPGVDAGEFDDVVATLYAAAPPRERLPESLRRRIVASAVHPPEVTRSRRSASSGWWAAAACFVLAVAGWWPRLVSTPGVAAPAPLSAAQERESLLARQNIVRVDLSAGPGGADAPLTGDVVFDPVTQTGYLRFRGIPANDPRLAQYQLWIADGSRAQPEPVDGGVFDVPTTATNGDIIVPFRAKLAVGAPAAFVVTVEQPGGVVVSRQERVLALGKVGA
jgi:hypothetical protein